MGTRGAGAGHPSPRRTRTRGRVLGRSPEVPSVGARSSLRAMSLRAMLWWNEGGLGPCWNGDQGGGPEGSRWAESLKSGTN